MTGDELTYGIWPNGCYVTFRESSRTERGTIDWESVIGVYGSAEEAKAAIAEINRAMMEAVGPKVQP